VIRQRQGKLFKLKGWRFAMDEISVEDIRTLFVDSLCTYKGDPVKAKECNHNKQVTVYYLENAHEVTVPFRLSDFGAPVGRIGYVNHGNHAFYFSRKPLRQYAVGVNRSNTSIKACPCVVDGDCLNFQYQLNKMEHKTIAKAMRNIYPKFEKALEQAIKKRGVYAFDKQFAVDFHNRIWYKNKLVGKIPEKCNTVDAIILYPEYSYLELPLLQSYEKTIKTFSQSK